MEPRILRERTSSHIFFQEPGGANACTPLQARQRWPDRLGVPRSTAILCTQSKTDRMVLITCSPSGYTPVVPESPDVLSYPCLLITAWQLVKAHGVTRNKPKIHVLCYITNSSLGNTKLYKKATLLNKRNSWNNNKLQRKTPHHHHVTPSSLISLTLSCHSSLSSSASVKSSGLHPYLHRVVVCRFGLVVLLLLLHLKGFTRVHHLWARPYSSSSVLHVWYV